MPQNPFDKLATPGTAPVARRRKSKNPFDALEPLQPAAPPASPSPALEEPPGFFENIGIGAQRAVLSAADAGRVLNEAVSAAASGDFEPLKQLAEVVGRGAAPFVAAAANPQTAPGAFMLERAAQAEPIARLTQQRQQRIEQIPELYSSQAVDEETRARLAARAGLDPSIAGKITRGGSELATSAIPATVAGIATGGSVPAVATVVGFQSLNQPENLIPNVALAATPLPIGKAVAPLIRRLRGIKPGEVAPVIESAAAVAPEVAPSAPIVSEAAAAAPSPAPLAAPAMARTSTEMPLPGVETRNPLLDQARNELLSVGIDPASERAGLPILQRRLKIGYAQAERLRDQLRIEAKAAENPFSALQTPPALSGIGQRAGLTTGQEEAEALNSAIRKLGTDSADEIAEMIANANRRFNKTITRPGEAKRPITPTERASAIEDYNRIKGLTKAEHDALAGVLPERTFAPATKMLVEGEPTARAISDIPGSEPNAQLDANLRHLKDFFDSQDATREARITAAVGSSANDLGTVRPADLGLDVSPVPVRPVEAVPVSRRISVDDISLGRDTLSKGRMFQAQESLKGGVKAETKGVPIRQQIEPMTVVPDPQRPGKFIVEDDGNHRVALLKLQGVTEDIPVKSFETPAQTAAITSTAGPRAGMVSPMEAEIGAQLNEVSRPPVARNMEPLDVGSMEGVQPVRLPGFEPPAQATPLEVGSMRGAQQLPLMDVAQKNRIRAAFSLIGDILQIPKSLMSSSDISFPFRQGMLFLAPPTRWGRSARSMLEMFRALIPDRPTSIRGGIKAQFQPKTERFQRMVDAIARDPDAATGQAAGLKLGSQIDNKFQKADGEFVSAIADRIPVVRESQQAYTMAADYTRLNTFKLYKQVIDKAAAEQGYSADQIKRGYQAAARWINIGSGRGNFGEKADKALDALSFFLFSPRFIASRAQVLNPLTYLRNATTAEGRQVLKLQMSELAQFTSMVGATLLLAKQAGFKVGTSPDNPDFLRISAGNYHYDGLAGLQSIMRLVYGVGKDAIRAAKGEPAEEGRTAIDVFARFLRGKAAPIPSAFVDYFDRKTFTGKPFNLTDAVVSRITPMQWQDFAEAYDREGIGGPLKLSPGFTGFGAQYYEPKPIDAVIEQNPSLLTELTRLQVRIADPKRKPNESDADYKGRAQAVANLYGRYSASVLANPEYANLPDKTKQQVFDLLHSRISDAVNTRDRRTGQFQPQALIYSLRHAATQKTIRDRLISSRPPL